MRARTCIDGSTSASPVDSRAGHRRRSRRWSRSESAGTRQSQRQCDGRAIRPSDCEVKDLKLETWPRGRRHSPAKGACAQKRASTVRIRPSPPTPRASSRSRVQSRACDLRISEPTETVPTTQELAVLAVDVGEQPQRRVRFRTELKCRCDNPRVSPTACYCLGDERFE